MSKSICRGFQASLVALALAGMTFAPVVQAGPRPGGGGGGGGHAGGGGDKHKVQANNNRTDVRTNNVRSTSVNNVNVNRNTNVNVNVDNNGCCRNGWDDDYHPVARAAAVTATVAVTAAVIGSIVNAPPPGCVPVNYGGYVYQQCGSTWYQPQGAQYIVVNPPY